MNAEKTMLYIERLQKAQLDVKFNFGEGSCAATNSFHLFMLNNAMQTALYTGKPCKSKTVKELIAGQ